MLLGILIISLVILTGCPIQGNFNVDATDEKKQIECKNRGSDYISVAGNCCLDENHNNKCDEEEAKAPCNDECSKPLCLGDNKKTLYDCVKKEDGCKHLESKGMLINECGVECFSESDCKSDERCSSNKCEKDRCKDGVQGTYEDCEECPEDFLQDGQYCCNKKVVQGNCCKTSDCKEHQECKENKCIDLEYCGNNKCDISENCGNCTVDCQTPKDSVCCSGNTFQGNCCSNEQCNTNETCISNLCTAIQQPQINETAANQTNSSG